MRERPLGHHAGHLASRAGCRPPAQTAARPNKRNHTAPGTPMDVETQRPEHRRTSRTPAAPQQHVVSYNPWPQPTKTPTFPHQQAEKSLQNQHVLSILQVGCHQLQYRFFRTNKPKSRHKTNTFRPLTQTCWLGAGHRCCGRAWPRFEPTLRAKLAGRKASGVDRRPPATRSVL